MSRWMKSASLVLVMLAVLVIFIKPDFLNLRPKYKKFETTPNASVALEKSLKKGRPVFLEFYAKW